MMAGSQPVNDGPSASCESAQPTYSTSSALRADGGDFGDVSRLPHGPSAGEHPPTGGEQVGACPPPQPAYPSASAYPTQGEYAPQPAQETAYPAQTACQAAEQAATMNGAKPTPPQPATAGTDALSTHVGPQVLDPPQLPAEPAQASAGGDKEPTEAEGEGGGGFFKRIFGWRKKDRQLEDDVKFVYNEECKVRTGCARWASLQPLKAGGLARTRRPGSPRT